jgi:polygalacturonase
MIGNYNYSTAQKKLKKISVSAFFLLISLGFFSCKWLETEKSNWDKVPLILERIAIPEIPDLTVSITDYISETSDTTDWKPFIDQAISDLKQKGGGKLNFPEGNYFIDGPIHLENNMNLHLEEGARLVFGSNPASYLPVVLTSWEGTQLHNYSPFIYARGKSNLAITGKGMIDGLADGVFNAWRPDQQPDQLLSRKMNNEAIPLDERIFGDGHYLRPHLVQFFECENILVEGVTILDSPFWCIHFIYSKNITVRDMQFNSPQMNNDGLDIESSEDVLIENVRFNNNDDNIAIKAGRDLEGRTLQRSSRNIVVRNCFFKGHNALAVGSEMSGGVENVFVENCSFDGEVRNGIYLKSNKDRGGKMSDIYIRNVVFGQVFNLIRIDSDYKGEGELYPPVFENVFIDNVTASEALDHGIYINGSEQQPVGRVELTNITIGGAKRPVIIQNAAEICMNNIRISGGDSNYNE